MNKDKSLKVGMYTEEEIFKFLTEEGGMLGRSMYDAIFDKIHTLITENEQLKSNWERLKEDIETERMDHFYPRPLFCDELLNKMNSLEGDK